MTVSKDPFDRISSGKKTIECRLFDAKRQKFDIGDTIAISQNDDPSRAVSVAIKALYRYASFTDLFEDFPPGRFGGDSKESLLQEISAYYSEDDQRENGIIGIGIEVLG